MMPDFAEYLSKPRAEEPHNKDNGEAGWREFQTGGTGISQKIIQRDLGASSKNSGSNSEEPKPTLSPFQQFVFDTFKDRPELIDLGAEPRKVLIEDLIAQGLTRSEIINSQKGMSKATDTNAAADDSTLCIEEDIEEDMKEEAGPDSILEVITIRLPLGRNVTTMARFAPCPTYRFSRLREGLPCKKHIAVLVKCFKKTFIKDRDRQEEISAWSEISRVWINLEVFQGRVDLHNYSNYRHEKALEISRHLSVIRVREEEFPSAIAEIFELVDEAVDTDTPIIWEMLDVTLISRPPKLDHDHSL